MLGVFEKESVLRNHLKTLSNQNILPSLTAKKMEVLFMEEAYIKDELNLMYDLS